MAELNVSGYLARFSSKGAQAACPRCSVDWAVRGD